MKDAALTHDPESGQKTMQPTPAPIPVVLLTGFLGSGKTTLLRHWLSCGLHRTCGLGVVMNDFGPVSVDSLLVAQPDLPLETIGGGCICCSDEQSLGDAIAKLAGRNRVRAIVVETSGLADPAATIELLHDLALAQHVRVQGVITVVDAEAVARPGLDGMDAGLWRGQIRFANWLLLSKCDRVSPAEVARVEAAVRRLNPHARVYRLPGCTPEPLALLKAHSGNGKTSTALARGRRSVRHAHRSYQTCGFQFTRAANREALLRFLKRLDPAQVVRAKGFVRLRGLPQQWFVFHYALGAHALEPFPGTEPPNPVSVFIGPQLDADRLQRRLNRVFPPTRRTGSADRARRS